jgi:hypothetical protein
VHCALCPSFALCLANLKLAMKHPTAGTTADSALATPSLASKTGMRSGAQDDEPALPHLCVYRVLRPADFVRDEIFLRYAG